MADNSTPFPFAALSVVAVFISTNFLGQQAFELWRPAETQARKQVTLPEPPVEARLWEDPVAAANRFREQARETCARATETDKSGAAARDCERSYRISAGKLKDSLVGQKLGDRLTVIPVLMQGGTLVGADEARRRARHALLAGLNSQGFMPDDSDRMGLLSVTICERLSGCSGDYKVPPEPSDVVYETLHTRAPKEQQRRVLVLWIDDTRFRIRWLSALTTMLAELAPPDARVRIVGPVSSDSLSKAVRIDAAHWADDVKAAKVRPGSLSTMADSIAVLSRMTIASPYASAPLPLRDLDADALGLTDEDKKECVTDCADAALVRSFLNAVQQLDQALPLDKPRQLAPPRLVRTLMVDDALATRLANELADRGVGFCDDRRIVLISEWDSVYARHFAKELKLAIAARVPKALSDCLRTLDDRIVVYSYARGLDGATAERSAEQARIGVKTSEDEKKKKRPIEWPEGQAQEDYVRRLVDEIRQNDRRSTVKAIGMIGYDLHDKLILVQALRENFPDRILFTTDIDARLVHPTTTRWTRNMIVASSLPLDPSGLVQHDGLDNDGEDKPPRIGPFRDSYQTSMFLSARVAGFAGQPIEKLPCLVDAIGDPLLFELGHRDAVALTGRSVREPPPAKAKCPEKTEAPKQWFEPEPRTIASMIAGVGLVALTAFLFAGFPGPAMGSIRNVLLGKLDASGKPAKAEWAKLAVAALQAAGVGFAAGVVLELGWPGAGGTRGPLVLALAFAAVLAVLVVRMPWVLRPLGIAGVVALAWWSWPAMPTVADVQEPLDPLSGTSAWPSLLIRTVMVVLVPWFLDRAWYKSAVSGAFLADKFFGLKPQDTGKEKLSLDVRKILPWLRDSTIWFWSPPGVVPKEGMVDGAALWAGYQRMIATRNRLGRVVLWTLVSGAAFGCLLLAISHAADRPPIPEIPARGDILQTLVRYTQWVSAIGLLLLLVLVGDDTVLTWRFVTFLEMGRTVYPDATVNQFASELGPELASEAATRVAALPRQRDPLAEAPADRRNSLLDDWIDARLLADQTEAVGPLIVYPFVLVGLALIARSPIFDNWDMGPGVLATVGIYLLWSVAMAILVNKAAERARQKALRNMALDLIWLEGTPSKDDLAQERKVRREGRRPEDWKATPARVAFNDLVPTFKELIDRVKGLRRGAFAPFFEKPWVHALLVPLGGAGGIQLIEFLLYARS